MIMMIEMMTGVITVGSMVNCYAAMTVICLSISNAAVWTNCRLRMNTGHAQYVPDIKRGLTMIWNWLKTLIQRNNNVKSKAVYPSQYHPPSSMKLNPVHMLLALATTCVLTTMKQRKQKLKIHRPGLH